MQTPESIQYTLIGREHISELKGITGVEGGFDIGDVVAVVGPEGEEIARGVALYSSREIKKIMGRYSDEIPKILGYSNGTNVIHRNDMVRKRSAVSY